MTRAYIVTGTITDAKTVRLDEPLPVSEGKVRVIVEPAETPTSKLSLQEYLVGLRQRQTARGHVPMTVEQVEARLRAERDTWDE
jgi:hypothetical protein